MRQLNHRYRRPSRLLLEAVEAARDAVRAADAGGVEAAADICLYMDEGSP